MLKKYLPLMILNETLDEESDVERDLADQNRGDPSKWCKCGYCTKMSTALILCICLHFVCFDFHAF